METETLEVAAVEILRELTKNLHEHMAMPGARHFSCESCERLVARATDLLAAHPEPQGPRNGE